MKVDQSSRSPSRPGLGLKRALSAFLTLASACSPAAESLRFAAMGDMGTGGPGQQQVAAAMADRARVEPIQFWLTLGDNIYPWGVLSAESQEWTLKFEEVYDDPSLRVPVYPTLGNHDHLGFPDAQIRYSERSELWSMPARYYTFSRPLADGTSVQFFALDTDIIRRGVTYEVGDAPVEERMEMVRRSAEPMGTDLAESLVRYIAERVQVNNARAVWRIILLAHRTDREISEELVEEALAATEAADHRVQLQWLDRSLAASTARWKIVYGHHPLYSHNPRTGHDPAMIERLEPILVRHGVDLYLAGHDHVLDMMKPIRGVHHVTSGGGSGSDEAYDVVQTDESHYAATGGGFTLFRVTAEEVTIEFVGPDGTTQHTQVLSKQAKR